MGIMKAVVGDAGTEKGEFEQEAVGRVVAVGTTVPLPTRNRIHDNTFHLQRDWH